MRILLLANPVSGRGRALAAARAAAGRLAAAGHDTMLEHTRPGGDIQWLRPRLEGCELLVVAGGDGAVRTACVATAGSRVPIYHLPYGTENLFSRDWGMDADAGTLMRAIRRGRVVRTDLGHADGHAFVLMVSVGLDAEVIDDLASGRRGAIRHRHYAGPIWRQWRRWRPPELQVTVDGRRIDDGRRGMVIVGNSRQYAMRLDPALRADPADGRLDVVFLPMRSRWSAIPWAVAMRCRRHVRSPRLTYVSGSSVSIAADEPFRYQLDGERPDGGKQVRRLDVTLEAGAVSVLVPG
ncbi:MAG: diacylglycerol/lipid kinase family protein [Planctomycetota bacterium]|jgi:diacylglycerol kinase family enzyme